MTEFERVLVNRDEITKTQARREKNAARDRLYELLADGGDYDDVEEMMASEYGLEMDYIFDLI